MSAVRPVGEVAAQVGLSTETLRYYERRGVLPAPTRDSAGRRVYRDADVHLIEVLLHLRDTGMPLARIAQFTRYVAADPECVAERLALLQQHRERVLAQIERLNRSLAVIDQKITDYARRRGS
jgi:DNA-binding transcriptional MerR regulator